MRDVPVTDETVQELFHNMSPFRVPRYQRAYAWTSEEIDDFVNDLAELARTVHGDPYFDRRQFFGAIVCVKERDPDDPTGYTLSVIDGQQRLATFFLAFRTVERELYALADQADQDDPETAARAQVVAEQTRDDYITRSLVVGTDKVWRNKIALSEADKSFFEDLVEANSVEDAEPSVRRDSHQRLLEAALQLRKDLIPWVAEPAEAGEPVSFADQLARLEDLTKAMGQHVHVVHVIGQDHDEAYRLFQVLNDRGKSLAEADHLRTETLQQTLGDAAIQERIAELWDHILERDSRYMDRFLRSFYPSHTGKRAPTRTMHHAFREHWVREKTPREILEFVKTLHDEEERFQSIYDGQWPYLPDEVGGHSAGISERLRVGRLVTTLKHVAAFPLLLAATRHMEEPEFAELVHIVSRFAFRYKNICNGNIARPSTTYYEHATRIRSDRFSLDSLKNDLAVHISDRANDGVFVEQIRQKLDYSQRSQHNNIRYFLTAIEEHLAWLKGGGDGPGDPVAPGDGVIDLSKVDIEHIYPSSPQPGHADNELLPIRDCIQNLTLWAEGDNRGSQNAPFGEKKELYAASAVRLTQDVSAFETWDAAAAEERKERLEDYALRVFRIAPD